jgi:hypothetical protein
MEVRLPFSSVAALVEFSEARTSGYINQPGAFMGNRAKRRAWAHHVLSDPRMTDLHRNLALTIAEMDRRGFVFCELDGELFFQPKQRYAAANAAAGVVYL